MGIPGIVIQARVWAERFPGKVFVDLGGETVLQHVVRRCKQVGVPVIVATPDASILSLADEYGAMTYLGDENDVLKRYVGCAKAYKLDSVVRVTADCPFIDPWVIQHGLARSEDYDYVTNVITRTHPYGLDYEVVRLPVLEQIALTQTERKYREHVTLYIREHLSNYKTLNVENPWGDASGYDWRLDRKEDVPYLRALYKCGGNVMKPFDELLQLHTYAEHLRAFAFNGDSPGRPPAVDGGHEAESADISHPSARTGWYERGHRVEGTGS